jgi:hypothetical protein
MWQVTTVIWGAAFLLDAALRVVMAYALPVNDVPALAGALWLVTFLLLQIITNVYLSRSGLWPILRGHQPAVPLDPSDRHTMGTGTTRTAAGPQKQSEPRPRLISGRGPAATSSQRQSVAAHVVPMVLHPASPSRSGTAASHDRAGSNSGGHRPDRAAQARLSLSAQRFRITLRRQPGRSTPGTPPR